MIFIYFGINFILARQTLSQISLKCRRPIKKKYVDKLFFFHFQYDWGHSANVVLYCSVTYFIFIYNLFYLPSVLFSFHLLENMMRLLTFYFCFTEKFCFFFLFSFIFNVNEACWFNLNVFIPLPIFFLYFGKEMFSC